MQSPFPGMDPYIEARGLWGDFHGHLIERIYEQLADAVPSHYFVQTGERSYHVMVGAEGKEERPFVSDVKITTPENGGKSRKKKGGVAVVEPAEEDGPFTLRAFIAEEYRERFVEIYEGDAEQRLVTTIEVLSPSNKRPGTKGWKQYLSKRQRVLLSGVNLVEIDLLRGGKRPPMLDPWPKCPYTLLVARDFVSELCKVWRAHFQKPLPEIPVPLAYPDADIPLRLQPMIDTIYKRSRYGQLIDYGKPLKPPLKAKEQAWLKERLRERQRQS